jgi:hypothetical protein
LNMEKQFFEQFPEARIAHEHQLQLAYAYVNPDWHSPGEFSPSDSQLPTSDSSSSGSSSLACSLDCAPVHGNQTPLNLSSPHGSSPGCMPYPSAGFSQPDTFLYPRPDPASSLQEPFEGFSATLPTTSSLSLVSLLGDSVYGIQDAYILIGTKANLWRPSTRPFWTAAYNQPTETGSATPYLLCPCGTIE